MSEQEQIKILQDKIWAIADDVRGAVDGWDFKQYVLGLLFYRFISENFKHAIENGDSSFNYEEVSEDLITDEVRDDVIKTKGYFIMPNQLFSNIVKIARSDDDLNTHLKEIFNAIEASSVGYPSEADFKGLFDDIDLRSSCLGNTVSERNKRLADILEQISALDFGNFEDNKIDLFRDAYEFLISKYESNAGKSGGEFFTPQNVSKLLAKIVLLGKSEKNKIYNPACGSRVIIMTVANSLVNIRVLELLPKFKTSKFNRLCTV